VTRARNPRIGPSAAAVLLLVGVAAALGGVGADARWLVALGRAIASDWSIPDGVPFASAASDQWHNVPVAGELGLDSLYALLGDRGLVLGQIAAVTIALGIARFDARARTPDDARVALALVVAASAVLPALLIARSQLFSLMLFPLLVALLRADDRARSNRIWLVVPLIAIWSNLHGAVLVGLVVLAAFLAFSRARETPLVAAGVFAASLAALCATPQREQTPHYYIGVLGNEAAKRGYGLWAPISITKPFDIILVLGATLLVVFALKSRPRLWEALVIVALAVLSVRAARSGVWLALFALAPAAQTLPALRIGITRVAAIAGCGLLLLGVVRGPLELGARHQLVERALAIAHGTPVLADATYGEQVALAGGRIWTGNPLDAFREPTQRLYLDWLEGKAEGDAAFTRSGPVALVRWGSPAQKRLRSMSRARLVEKAEDVALYEIRRGG
jgi:hypothetical protein